MPEERPLRIAILWASSFKEARQGTELLGEHLRQIFPGSELITISDCPCNFLKKFKFRWFRLDEIFQALFLGYYFTKKHKKDKFDLIIAQGVMGLYFSVFKPKIPLIHILNYIIVSFSRSKAITNWKDRMRGNIWGFLERISGWRKDCRVTICEDTKADIKKYYNLDYNYIVPLAVDTNLFYRGDKKKEREALKLPQDSILALFVGRLEYAKGYDILLKAVKAFPNINFVVISPRFEKDIKQNNVIFRNRLTPEEMARYYRAADFLFHPSRFESGICYVLLEAMASNLPLIVNRDGLHNLPSGVHSDDLGLILPDYKEKDFINTIQEFVSSPVPVSTKDIIEQHYSLDLFKKRWQRLINSLCLKQ